MRERRTSVTPDGVTPVTSAWKRETLESYREERTGPRHVSCVATAGANSDEPAEEQWRQRRPWSKQPEHASEHCNWSCGDFLEFRGLTVAEVELR